MTDPAKSPSGRQFPITAGPHRAVAVEVGGGIREYTVRSEPASGAKGAVRSEPASGAKGAVLSDKGAEPAGAAGNRPILAGFAEDVMAPHSAGAVLVPWPNRIRNGRYRFGDHEFQLPLTEVPKQTAIHGLARWARWSGTATDNAVELSYELPPQTGYPFPLHMAVRWSVGPDGLRADHTATNTGAAPVPYGLGIHPYLHLGGMPVDQAWLRIPAATALRLDEQSCPVGTEPIDPALRAGTRLGDRTLDTPFTDLDRGTNGIATVELRTQHGPVEIWLDASFPYIQAYTAAGFAPGVDAVAIEPMSCAPDAFNTGDGLVVLQPGETWTGSWGIRPI